MKIKSRIANWTCGAMLVALGLVFIRCGSAPVHKPVPVEQPAQPVFQNGELKHEMNTDLNNAWSCLNEAIKGLNVEVRGTRKEDSGAEMRGFWENREPFVVRLRPKGERWVGIEIKIGKEGNPEESKRLLSLIQTQVSSKRRKK